MITVAVSLLVYKTAALHSLSPLTVTPPVRSVGSIVIIPIIGKQTISAHSLTASHVAGLLISLTMFSYKYATINNF